VSDGSLSILHHRPLTRFWLARVATSVSFQMQAVAVGWQLYDLTSNPLDLGLVGLIQFIPVLLLMLIAGQVVDRHDRRVVLALSQAVEGAGALVLALATLAGVIDSGVIFCTAFLLGAARSFESTASQTMLPGIVPAPVLPRAVGCLRHLLRALARRDPPGPRRAGRAGARPARTVHHGGPVRRHRLHP
jgi:MFS family permease